MKIRYIIAHGSAEWVDFDPRGKDELTLKFNPRCSGTVRFGTDIFILKDGEVALPTAALRNGKNTPRIECELGAVAVSPFIKSGRSIAMAEDHGKAVRAIIRDCFELVKARDDLEKRVTQLEDLCKGHDIFNFERT